MLLYGLLQLGIAIVIHEFGHMIYFKQILKTWPELKITWWGISPQHKDQEELSLRELNIIAIAGILGGLIFLIMISAEHDVILMYLLMCMMDFAIVINFFSAATDKKTKMFIDIPQNKLKIMAVE